MPPKLSITLNGESITLPSNKLEDLLDSLNLQNKRYAGIKGVYCNAQLTDKLMNQYCSLDDQGSLILRSAIDKLKLSARSFSRIIKVSRTIADMDQSETIKSIHVAEAIQYRGLDRIKFLN